MNSHAIRKKKIAILIDFAIILAVALLYYFRNIIFIGIPECIIKKYTGFHCISCGGTRALLALFHFDIMGAIRENVFLVITGLVIIIGWASYNIMIIFYQGHSLNLNKKLPSKQMVILFCLLAGIFWIVRNIPCYPFILLAPR